MFGMLTSLAKAATVVITAPVSLVVDVVKLPATAFEDKNPFTNTSDALNTAMANLKDATKPLSK